jgi:hypothetical protein
MLYADIIDLAPERHHSTVPAQEAPDTLDGHGTGVSTDRDSRFRSFTPDALTLALSVLGNTIGGAAFLVALYCAPHALTRLFELL